MERWRNEKKASRRERTLLLSGSGRPGKKKGTKEKHTAKHALVKNCSIEVMVD